MAKHLSKKDFVLLWGFDFGGSLISIAGLLLFSIPFAGLCLSAERYQALPSSSINNDFKLIMQKGYSYLCRRLFQLVFKIMCQYHSADEKYILWSGVILEA